jgi:hypothetical protein
MALTYGKNEATPCAKTNMGISSQRKKINWKTMEETARTKVLGAGIGLYLIHD